MRIHAPFAAVARLELADVLRSRWMAFCVTVYTLLAILFVLVGLKESSVLGFTGMGRVLLTFCHALLVFLPLLALTATGQVVNHAREDGTLELLFSQPISRGAYFRAVSTVRYVVLTVPLVVLVVLMALYGRLAYGQAVPWGMVLRVVVVSAALLWCFVGIGMLISTLVRHPARAMILMLLAWAAGVALLDFGLIGLMLQWRLEPRSVFALAVMNPVQDARLALLSGIDPELATLGPVGFYLANRIGSGALTLLGLAWPVVLGLGAWWFALVRFRWRDIA